jgi:hypothetical protein
MFASKTTKAVEVGQNSVIVRKLSATQLERATDARQVKVQEGMVRMGAELIRTFTSDPEAKAKAAANPNARYEAYDRATVLGLGILLWSGPDVAGKPTAETIDDLDEEAADLIHRAIIDLSAPPAKVVEEQAKND